MKEEGETRGKKHWVKMKEIAQAEKLGRTGVAAKTINGVWLNWDNWRELLEKVHG